MFELIDGKTVAPKVEEGPLPFFLMVHPILNPAMKFRGFLPFITGQGKDAVMGVQFGNIKGHLRLFSVLDDIHGQVPLHQLVGPLFGQGQKVAVQAAALCQFFLGQCWVRHGILVQCLFLGTGKLGRTLLAGSLLQRFDHG